jgi:hypothetical protein
MDHFHLEDVFGRRVIFCIPEGEWLQFKIEKNDKRLESSSGQVSNMYGHVICRLFIDIEIATNTPQLYLGYAVALDPQVNVRILEGARRLRVGSCVKIYPHKTVAVVAEKTPLITNILLAI